MRLLGRGQHGAAVLLRSPDGGDVVVAKQVATEGLGPSELEKVESEVRILQRFSHANVVSYFCCFLHEETLSIVMEYCDGGTLAEAISAHAERSEHFATALVATWAKQLGGAVQHVHAHRVLHRDIKTANVFLTAQRQIKLGDFGISRVMGTHTNLAETVCGTPYYLSPELVMGQPYNQPADAWAIGVILYELLTLKRPFTGPNIAALVLKITRCDYDRAALGDSPHPPELHSLATSDALLAADPAKRLTLDALLATPAVAAAADTAPPPPAVAASRSSSESRSRRRSSDSPAASSASAAAPAADATAAGLTSTAGGSRRRTERRERRAAVVVQAAARRWLACAEARRRRAQLAAEITWAVDATAVGTLAAAAPLAAARAAALTPPPAAPFAAPSAAAAPAAPFAVTRSSLDVPSLPRPRRSTSQNSRPRCRRCVPPRNRCRPPRRRAAGWARPTCELPPPASRRRPRRRTPPTPPAAAASSAASAGGGSARGASASASPPPTASGDGTASAGSSVGSSSRPRTAEEGPASRPRSAEGGSVSSADDSPGGASLARTRRGRRVSPPPVGGERAKQLMPLPLPEPPGGWPSAPAGGGGGGGGGREARPPPLDVATFSIEDPLLHEQQPALFKRDDESTALLLGGSEPALGPRSPVGGPGAAPPLGAPFALGAPPPPAAAKPFAFTIEQDDTDSPTAFFQRRT